MAFKLKSPLHAKPMFVNYQKGASVEATGGTIQNPVASGGIEQIRQKPIDVDALVKQSESTEGDFNPRKTARLDIREDKRDIRQAGRTKRQELAADRMNQRYYGSQEDVTKQAASTPETNYVMQNQGDEETKNPVPDFLTSPTQMNEEKPNRAGRPKGSGLLMKMDDTTPLNKKSFQSSQQEKLMSDLGSSPIGFMGLDTVGKIAKGIGNAKDNGGGLGGVIKGVGKSLTGGDTDDKLDKILTAVSGDDQTNPDQGAMMPDQGDMMQDPSALSMNPGFEALPQDVQDDILKNK